MKFSIFSGLWRVCQFASALAGAIGLLDLPAVRASEFAIATNPENRLPKSKMRSPNTGKNGFFSFSQTSAIDFLQMNDAGIKTDWLTQVKLISQVFESETVEEQPASSSEATPETSNLNAADSLEQIPSVTQLSDVQPTDWAFEALQSLAEKYGCIAGYTDSTYRGQRTMTRYEFAAGLNACVDLINKSIAASTADSATQKDLAILKRLQEEFAAELKTLGDRTNNLEARTSMLEARQFSATTKLNGSAIFAISDAFSEDNKDQLTVQYRYRLLLNTSFTGRDLLTIGLYSGNAATDFY